MRIRNTAHQTVKKKVTQIVFAKLVGRLHNQCCKPGASLFKAEPEPEFEGGSSSGFGSTQKDFFKLLKTFLKTNLIIEKKSSF